MTRRVPRVEDILMRLQERVHRTEGSVFGREKGIITDLLRTISETAKVSDSVTSTEHTANAFAVGTAVVGFSTVG